MTSNKQKRAEMEARKAAEREKRLVKAVVAARQEKLDFLQAARLRGEVLVNPERLAPSNSYDTPEFVQRGTYRPIAFTCKTCGKAETWTPHQQKWWYEAAKGGLFTTATMCRPCRGKERARKEEARRTHLEGLARKKVLKDGASR